MTEGQLYNKKWTVNDIYGVAEYGDHEDEISYDEEFVTVKVLDEAKQDFPKPRLIAPYPDKWEDPKYRYKEWFEKWFGGNPE